MPHPEHAVPPGLSGKEGAGYSCRYKHPVPLGLLRKLFDLLNVRMDNSSGTHHTHNTLTFVNRKTFVSVFCRILEALISQVFLAYCQSVEFFDKIPLHNIPAGSIEFCEIKYTENLTISGGKS
jgi:hypothetical protein